MKKKVTLARALKEKNRLVGRIVKLRKVVGEENSTIVGAARSVDVRAIYDNAKALTRRLVSIKTAISRANIPIVSKLVEMEELKSAISYLNRLNTSSGMRRTLNERYASEELCEYSAVITMQDVLNEVEAMQKRIEDIQDELDDFNASTTVEIELDD